MAQDRDNRVLYFQTKEGLWAACIHIGKESIQANGNSPTEALENAATYTAYELVTLRKELKRLAK